MKEVTETLSLVVAMEVTETMSLVVAMEVTETMSLVVAMEVTETLSLVVTMEVKEARSVPIMSPAHERKLMRNSKALLQKLVERVREHPVLSREWTSMTMSVVVTSTRLNCSRRAY